MEQPVRIATGCHTPPDRPGGRCLQLMAASPQVRQHLSSKALLCREVPWFLFAGIKRRGKVGCVGHREIDGLLKAKDEEILEV